MGHWFLKAKFNTVGKYKRQQATAQGEKMHGIWLFENCNLLQELVTTETMILMTQVDQLENNMYKKIEVTYRTLERCGTIEINWCSSN